MGKDAYSRTLRSSAGQNAASETAAELLRRYAADATGAGLRDFLDRVPNMPPQPGDELDDQNLAEC